MGLFSTLVKGGIATALINQARKPANQERAKRAFAQLKNRGGGSSSGPAARHRG